MATASGKAVKRSVLRSVGFSIISSIYGLYWFYVTRTAVDQEVGESRALKISPSAQVIALIVVAILGFVPIVGLLAPLAFIVFAYGLLKDIGDARVRAGLAPIPVAVYVVVPMLSGIILALIPVLGLLAPIVTLVFFGLTVQKLNEYWDKQGASDAPYTTGEIIAIIAGIVLNVLIFILISAAILALIGLSNDPDIQNELQNELNSGSYSY